MSTYFIGIDLAWSSRNATGFSALKRNGDAANLICCCNLYTDEEVIDAIESIVTRKDDVIVAVDAPLTVPNQAGRRPAETEIDEIFHQYGAGAFPCNRNLLTRYNNGIIRGEAIVDRLRTLNIVHRAAIETRKQTRQVFEVYPHPAMVVLFRLQHILKYKKKRRRQNAERMKAFDHYQGHLQNLSNPPWSLNPTPFSEYREFGAADLKRYEDRIDSLFCSYLAFYYWWWGKERCSIYGNFEEGYIVSPTLQN